MARNTAACNIADVRYILELHFHSDIHVYLYMYVTMMYITYM